MKKMEKTKNINFINLALLITVIIFSSTNIFAGNTNDFINQARLQRDKTIKEIAKNKVFWEFIKVSPQNRQQISNHQHSIEAIKNRYMDKFKTKGDIKKAIVFVSFSMPELSLKQIIHDAARYQVPVVIRGLYQNSFRKTVEKMFEFVKENKKGGIAINPKWFKEYEIKAVPAVVVAKEHGARDVVYGNIPLKKALLLIADRGELSDVAQTILTRDNK